MANPPPNVVVDIGTQCEALTINKPVEFTDVTIQRGSNEYMYDSGGSIQYISLPVRFGNTTESRTNAAGQSTSISYIRRFVYLDAFKFNVKFLPSSYQDRSRRTIKGNFNNSTISLNVQNFSTDIPSSVSPTAQASFTNVTGANFYIRETGVTPSVSIINSIQTTETPTHIYIKVSDTTGINGSGTNNYLCYDGTARKFFVKNLAAPTVTPSDITKFKFVSISINDGDSDIPISGIVAGKSLTGIGIALHDSGTILKKLGVVTYEGTNTPVLIYNSTSFGLDSGGSNRSIQIFHLPSQVGNLNDPSIYTTSINYGADTTDNSSKFTITQSVIDTVLGMQTVLFRYGESCINNLFLKVPQDGTISTTGTSVATTTPFRILDYFSDADPRRSFQFFFEDNGRIVTGSPNSNTYTWWVSSPIGSGGSVSARFSNIWVDNSTGNPVLKMSSPGSASNPPQNQGWIIQNGTGGDSSNVALIYVTSFDSTNNRFNGPAYAINPPRALTGTPACTTMQPNIGMLTSANGVSGFTGLNYALKCVRCSTSGAGGFCLDGINDADRTSIVNTVFTA